MKRCAGLFLLALAPLLGQSSDGPLADIRSELDRVRAERDAHAETRGASPRFTTIKHLLRDWIESHFGSLTPDTDEAALARELNGALEQAHLFDSGANNDSMSLVGSLGSISLELLQRGQYLVVKTGVGVECGFDQSAYLYQRREGHWASIWQSEQNTYTKEGYNVQTLHAVHVSPAYEGADSPFLLTLGTAPWCTSNWRPVFFRIWRTRIDGSDPKLLVDRTVNAYLGSHDIPIQGSIGRKDALIEFSTGSIDTDLGSRPSIWHYKLHGDTAERIDPIALNPGDFVEEWLTTPWSQIRWRTQAANRLALKRLHGRLQDYVFAEFTGPALRCQQDLGLWQVGLDFGKRTKYFLVRWTPVYRFTMVQALDHPSPVCTEKDNEALWPGTLFPVQDWRE